MLPFFSKVLSTFLIYILQGSEGSGGWAVDSGHDSFPKIEPDFEPKIVTFEQGGITCGAIEDPRKSSKAIDERVIINFRDKNGVIARFRDKNVVIVRFCDKNVECLYIYYGVIEE